MQLHELVREVGKIARPWLESHLSRDQATACTTLLATGGFHIDQAAFGARLYAKLRDPARLDLMRALGEDHTTLEASCTNLVARCGVTALDLCAATAARIIGLTTKPLGGAEQDIRRLLGRKTIDTELPVSSPMRFWMDDLLRQPDWSDLESLRHEVTHRCVGGVATSRSACLGGPPSAGRSKFICLLPEG